METVKECQSCHYQTNVPGDLQKHRKAYHKPGQKPCDTCGKPYNNPGDTCQACLDGDLGSVDHQGEE